MLKNNEIGEKIKKARILRGISQAKFAEELGIAASAVAAYETGKRIPKIELREEMARVLMIDPLELAGLGLTEDDERRILNKLLMKYSKDIVKNDDGTISAIFYEDYAHFQEIYNELHAPVIRNEEYSFEKPYKIDISPLIGKEDYADFWLESWPLFDYCQVIKRCIPESSLNDDALKNHIIEITKQNMNAIYFSRSEDQLRKYAKEFNKSCKAKQHLEKSEKKSD